MNGVVEMGKPRNWYYYDARKMVQKYPAIKKDNSFYAITYTNAIEETIKETKKLHNGDLRVQAMKLIFFEHTHTIEGAALQLYVSYETIKKWISEFINAVGDATCLYKQKEED